MQGSVLPRIRKKGRDAQGRVRENLKVYDVSIRYNDPITGKRKQMLRRGFLTKGAAAAFLLEQQDKLRQNTFVVPKPVSFKTFLEGWYEDYVAVNLRPSTKAGYTAIIDRHLIPHLGGLDLKEIKSADIDRLYAFLLREGRSDGKGGLSARTVIYTHRVLHEAMEYAIKRQLIFFNPAKGVLNLPKVQKRAVNVYNEAELRQLFSLTTDTVFELPALLAAVCGLRRGEILALTEDDVNWEGLSINVNKQLLDVDGAVFIGPPKSTESNRTIHVPVQVFVAIEKAITTNAANRQLLGIGHNANKLLVCDALGNPIRPRYFSKNFAALIRRHRLKNITFHGLRHCAASLMLRTGVPMKTTSSILGHSSVGITLDLYTHVMEDAKKEAAELVSKRLFP